MGTFGSGFTKKKIGKILGITIAAPVVSCLALYLFLLGMQAYSTWQAGRMLDRLEPLRVGDSSADFAKAVRGCEMEKTSSADIYVLFAGAFRLQGLWRLAWKLPDRWVYGLGQLANRAGLRYWYLNISSSAEQGHITEVSANLYLVGRYEALGTKWQIGPSIPSHYVREG